MNTTEVIAALRERQTIIMADIRAAEQMLAKLREDQASIVAAIRVFDPNAPTRPPLPDGLGFQHGHLTRAILDVLRRSEAPLAPRDIAAKLLEGKPAADDPAALAGTLARVRTALARMKDKLQGEVKGQTVYWRVVG